MIKNVENGKVSEVLSEAYIKLDKGYSRLSNSYIYEEEEKIASYVTYSFSVTRSFLQATEEPPIIYGIAEEKNIFNLKILGEEPTKIVPNV